MRRLPDHRARELALAQVVVHERGAPTHRADRQHRVVDLELTHELERRRTEDRGIVRAQFAAGEVDTIAVATGQRARDLEAVGDDQQVRVASQRERHVGGGRPGVEHQRVAVGDQRRHRLGNPQLGLAMLAHATLERRLGESLRQHDATMYATHQAARHQRLNVASNGLTGHREFAREFADGAGTAQAHRLHDLRLAFADDHREGRARPA